jgi:hypothetical protein
MPDRAAADAATAARCNEVARIVSVDGGGGGTSAPVAWQSSWRWRSEPVRADARRERGDPVA